VRARWRIAWNTLRRGARWRRLTYGVVVAALAFLSLVSLGFSWGMTFVIGGVTNDPTAADVLIASTLSGTLVLSFLVSFTVALAALYLSRDLDLLLAAPISRRAVFASKLVGGLMPGQLLILTIGIVPLVGHGIAQRYGWPYYAAMLLAMLLLPVLPSAIGALSVVTIVRRVPAHRLGEIVGLIVVAMTLSIAMVTSSAGELRSTVTVEDLLFLLERFRNPYSPAEWLTRGLAASGRGEFAEAARWFGAVTGLSVLVALPLHWASDKPYYEGYIHMQSANLRRQLSSGWLPWQRTDRADRFSRKAGWVLGWLPVPVAAIVRKDLRLIPRDLTNMAQVLSPLAVGVFFVLQQLLYPVRIGGDEVMVPYVRPLLTMLSAAISAGVASMIFSRFGLTAFSFEGRRYWVVKSAPISPNQLIAGKFLVGYLPYLVVGGSLLLLLEFARSVNETLVSGVGLSPAALWANTDLPGALYALFVVAVIGVGVLIISLALGAARPNMRWDSPHEMMTPDVGCISLVLYGAYLGVTLAALALPSALSQFPMMRDVALPLWLAGLSLGVGLTVVLGVAGWRLAAGELDSVGE